MHDPLLFSECLLSWVLANYAYCSDPACDDEMPGRRAGRFGSPLPAGLMAWSVAVGIALVIASGFHPKQLIAAAMVAAGSVAARWMRRSFIPVRYLMDLEIALCGLATVAFYLVTNTAQARTLPSFGNALSTGRWSVLCMAAALLIYMVRGGNYIVRGILKRAGGMPDSTEPGFETREGYAHGRMIGQIERIIVVLVVMAGSLSALAFFFAAKGLIRSKELEDRARADYFLLGSLASFLVALAAGLILQQVIGHLWHG